MTYRLALDIGSTSLGWCILGLRNNQINSLIDMGVRIFPDGREDKSKEPLAVSRRNARSIRRNLDRRDKRQKRLMTCLIQNGLMPANEQERKVLEALNPYALRAKALDEKLPPYHLGRALFHLNQRRGFKSNLKTDKGANDAGNMKTAIKDLDARMMHTGCRTLGEYLYKEGPPVRVKSHMEKNKAVYNFYPGREMYEKEFDLIVKKQDISESLAAEIKDIIFFQRRLKPVKPGSCRFEDKEDRARLALPVVQKFRILQEVNNLEIDKFHPDEPNLTLEQRQKIAAKLLTNKKQTFSQIRKLLGLSSGVEFNLESEKRKELKGDDTAAILSDKKCFGDRWFAFSADEQEKIIDRLFAAQDPEKLIIELTAEYNLDKEKAEYIAYVKLMEGYGAVSKKAIEKMLPFLEQGYKYHDAAKMAGYHHSDFRTGEIFEIDGLPQLPYYGEALPNSVIGGSYDSKDQKFPEKFYGKINNPTVHIALNQIRKLVNAIIQKYGPPEQVVIEMARDLKAGQKERADINKEQAKNTKDNERINKELEKLGVRSNYINRMKFKLWEDLSLNDPLKRVCPFCTDENPIACHQIFTPDFEVEHILPFSRSYNDGRMNKVLAHRHCNRKKGNRAPYEAFGHTNAWETIAARVLNLPKAKQWRFQEDAWAKMDGEDGIIARMLNDTRYMARIAKQYLAAVFDQEKGKNNVWAIPGQMTSMLRDKWGLNDLLDDVWRERLDEYFPDKPQLVEKVLEEDNARKNRTHHMHHAVDAFVVGCSDRGMLKAMADAARRLEEDETLREKRLKLVSDMPEPFPGFREDIRGRLRNLTISYKPDHGNAKKAITADIPYTVASLHQETAYGYIGKGEKKGTVLVATRKPVLSFDKMKNINEIADEKIKETLKNLLSGIKEGSNEWKQALEDYSTSTGTKRLRVHLEKSENVLIGVKQPQDRGPEKTRGQEYKRYALGGNYCAEVYCPQKGKNAGKWGVEIISNYHAHKKDFIPQWQKDDPTAKLMMRLQINDMVAYEDNGTTVISRVKKLTKGMAYLRPNIIAKEEADKLTWPASGNQLQLKNARKISVDIMGNIKDHRGKKYERADHRDHEGGLSSRR